MKKGFTLIELVVAVAILAMAISFTAMIFNISIETYRTAGAEAEIMQKFRAITDQLSSDFSGLCKDAPVLIWFEQDYDPNGYNYRFDQIMFFANGDFQSTPIDGSAPVTGNVARIHYAQAQSIDPRDNLISYPYYLREEDRVLARRQHILTADSTLDLWPDPNNTVDYAIDEYTNEFYEHDRLPLSQWKTIDRNIYRDTIVPACFDFRPEVDTYDPNTFHKLMCEGVGSFSIQWAYWNPDIDPNDDELCWYPSDDPNGDYDSNDSHFANFTDRNFGVFFNIAGNKFSVQDTDSDWYPINDPAIEYKTGIGGNFRPDFFPKAFKFTLRIYDSKGIIKEDGREGRTFTHIVYLDH